MTPMPERLAPRDGRLLAAVGTGLSSRGTAGLATLKRPRAVHTMDTDSTFRPHWSSRDPGSDRLVFPTEAPGDARILIARFDTTTGRLAWDESFRDPESGRLGVSFKREAWPHGAHGPAAPHGVVFGNGRIALDPSR